RQPDFSRGFSERPEARFKVALAGTQLFNGWGAACYRGSDASFADWTCAKGLQCRTLYDAAHNPGMGTCITASRKAVGDPLEAGKVTYGEDYGDEAYERTDPSGPIDEEHYLPENLPNISNPSPSDQYYFASQGAHGSSGGFPAGMLWLYFGGHAKACHDLPRNAACGWMAGDGFNECIGEGKPFPKCLKYALAAGLRACEREHPCRDDYICTAPDEKLTPKRRMGIGACIPPYFMFQFRVDGHPAAYSRQQQ